jgi:nucleoside-diphosphate-sugar epimerase
MKVLITGGAGFLGRAFVRHHLNRMDKVLTVDDLSAAGAHWVDDWGYQRVEQDVMDYFARPTFDSFDLAYHFAAPVGGREKIEGDPLYNADSLRLDSMFFRWARGRVGTAVYPSSSAVYGTVLQSAELADWERWALTEANFDPRDDRWFAPDEMYGFTKMAGEVLASKAAQYGLNTLCIRPFSGYGEEQALDYPMPSITRRAALREDPLTVWGAGTQTRDFIHVDDLVGATQAVLDRGVEGYEAINLGSGVATSFITVAELAAMAAGYSPTITTDPGKPQGVASRFADPTRMLALYQPKVSLEAGIARMVEAYRGGS